MEKAAKTVGRSKVEVSVLRAPALYLLALWLRDEKGDRLVPIAPCPPPLKAGETYPAERALRCWPGPQRQCWKETRRGTDYWLQRKTGPYSDQVRTRPQPVCRENAVTIRQGSSQETGKTDPIFLGPVTWRACRAREPYGCTICRLADPIADDYLTVKCDLERSLSQVCRIWPKTGKTKSANQGAKLPSVHSRLIQSKPEAEVVALRQQV